MRNVCITLIIVLAGFNAFAITNYDNYPLDTLLQELARAKNSKDSIQVYFKLSSHFVNTDIKLAEAYANKVLETSKAINYKKGEADGYYALGRIFHNSHFDISFNFVSKALEIYTQIGDQTQIAKSLNLISIIKSYLGDYQSALDYSNKILDISLQIGDSTLYAMVLNNIGTYYSDFGSDTTAENYYRKAAYVNAKTGHKRFLSINYGNICYRRIMMKDLTTARTYFYKSMRLKEEINDKEGFAWLYETYAEILSAENKYDSALFYYHKSNELCEIFNNRNQQIITIDSLQHLYYRMGNIDSAYSWLVKLNAIRDSVFDKDKTKSIYLYEISLKHKQEQELNKLKHKAQVFKMALVILTLGISVLTTILVILILNNRRKKIKKEQEITVKEKENLEQELVSKNQELTTHVMNLVNKNQMVNSVIDKLNANQQEFLPANRKLVQSITSELSASLNKEIWKEFELRFNSVHPEFQNKLLTEFPDLTPNELKLCAFLKMNMASKEISEITYQSVQSIEKARSRLRKKLNLTNTDKSLVYFLSLY